MVYEIVGMFAPFLLYYMFGFLGDSRFILGRWLGVEVSVSIPNNTNCFGFIDKKRVPDKLNADMVCRAYSLLRVALLFVFMFFTSNWVAEYFEKWGRESIEVENMERSSVCGQVTSVVRNDGGKWPVSEILVKDRQGVEREVRLFTYTLIRANNKVGRSLRLGDEFCIERVYLDGYRTIYRLEVSGKLVDSEEDFVDNYINVSEFPFSLSISLFWVMCFVIGLREVADE